MNNFKLLLLLFSLAWQVNGQSQKEIVVVVFDKANMNFEGDRFVIDGQIFRCVSTKKKCQVNYRDIKDNISTIDDMNLTVRRSTNYNKNKREEFYYETFFDIYIYVAESNTSGLLYPVERIWTVEGKMID